MPEIWGVVKGKEADESFLNSGGLAGKVRHLLKIMVKLPI